MEYLLIIAIALVLIIPTFYFFFTNAQKSTDTAVAEQINRIGLELTQAIDTVHSYGRNAKLTVEFTMPINVEDIYLRNGHSGPCPQPIGPVDCQYPAQELIFELLSSGRTNQIVFFTDVPFKISPNCNDGVLWYDTFTNSVLDDGVINPGKKEIQAISCGTDVAIWLS